MKLMTSEGINRLHLKMISESITGTHVFHIKLDCVCLVILFTLVNTLLTNYVVVMDKNEYLSFIYVLFYTSLLYRYRTYYKT